MRLAQSDFSDYRWPGIPALSLEHKVRLVIVYLETLEEHAARRLKHSWGVENKWLGTPSAAALLW
jgi:hypothetical protein